MERLCEIFRQLGNSLDLSETLSTLDRELRHLIAYHTIAVHLVEGGRLEPIYAAGRDQHELTSQQSAMGGGLPADAAVSHSLVTGAGAVAVPVPYEGRDLAVLSLYGAGDSSFSEIDQNLLLALAPKLGASIGNACRFARVESTGRRAFFERLDAELARTRRGGGSLAVIECSVKNPDRTACGMDRIEAGLRSLCREYDFVSRREQGFVIVLADFARAHLREKQARIESAFRNAGLNVSIGVAFFPEDGVDAEDLLARVHGAVHA